MRRITLWLLFLIGSSSPKAQTSPKSLSLYTAVVNDAQFIGQPLMGDWSHESQTGHFQIGVDYSKPLSNKLSVNVGVQFSAYRFRISYTPYPGLAAAPDDDYQLSFLGFPLTLQWSFWKYAYLRTGFLVDIQIANALKDVSTGKTSSTPTRSGIGSVVGLGAQIPVSGRLSFYAGLNQEIHSLIPFSASTYRKKVGDVNGASQYTCISSAKSHALFPPPGCPSGMRP